MTFMAEVVHGYHYLPISLCRKGMWWLCSVVGFVEVGVHEDCYMQVSPCVGWSSEDWSCHHVGFVQKWLSGPLHYLGMLGRWHLMMSAHYSMLDAVLKCLTNVLLVLACFWASCFWSGKLCHQSRWGHPPLYADHFQFLSRKQLVGFEQWFDQWPCGRLVGWFPAASVLSMGDIQRLSSMLHI